MKLSRGWIWIWGLMLLGFVVLGGILASRLLLAPEPVKFQFATTFTDSKPMADFSLSGGANTTHALSESRGKVVMLFFGYTHCPDVCPLTLTNLAEAMRRLGPLADRVQVVMVSVDPERDSPDRMAEFVARFDPRFLGLSGTPAEIAAVAKTYGIYYSHDAPDAQGAYAVAHYAGVLTFDKAGNLRAIFPFGVTGEQFAQDLQRLVE